MTNSLSRVCEGSPRLGHARLLCVALSAVVSLLALGMAAPAPASAVTVCNVYLEPEDPDGTSPPSTSGGCYSSELSAEEAAFTAQTADNAKRASARSWVKIGLDCDSGLSEVCAFTDHLVWWGQSGRCDDNTR